MSDDSVGLVRVAAPELVVPPAVWKASGFALPILLSRDVIIEGDERLSEWPILYFKGAKEKMKLAGNVTLHVMNMFLKDMRSKPTRAPGLDILAPTDPDVAPSTVIFGPAAGSFGVCWPLIYQLQDFMLLERPRQFPGKNTLGTYETREMLLQEGCVEDRSAAPTKRCWASKIFTPDLAAYGADYDAVKDRLVSNNQLYHAVNSVAYCEMLVDDYCLTVEGKDPLLCFTEAERRYEEFVMGGAAGGSGGSGSNGSLSPAVGAQTPPPAMIWEYGRRTSSSGLTEGARIGLICGASVAGALLLAGVSATVAVVRIRRRRRQREDGYSVSDVKADGGRGSSKLTRIFFVRTDDSIGGGTTSSASPASPAALGPGGCAAAPSAANPSTEFSSGNGTSAALTSLNGGVQQRSKTLLLPLSPTEDKPVTPLTKPRRELSLNVQLIDLEAASTASSAQHQQQRKLGSEAVVAEDGEDPSEECAAEGSVIIDVAAPNKKGAKGGGGDGDGSAAGGGDGSAAGGGDGRAGGPPQVELLPVTLGRGTFGRVVQGMFCGRKVAVKLMAGEASIMGGGGGGEPKAEEKQADEGRHYSNVFLQSFVQEVQVLSRLQHRNVVKLLAACVTPPRLCLVMELMETSLEALLYGGGGGGRQGGGRDEGFGNTLQQSPLHNPRMPLEKVLHVGIEIATALAYLHPTIVHRDLKPANVLVNDAASDRPIIKLTDFGLSRLRVTVATTKHPDAGTPPYMAPECFDVTNRRITHKSDIYSLGIMLWEMLAGVRPWAEMAPVAVAFLVAYKGGRPPLDALNEHRCPPKLMRLIKSCWETDPARRPAAAEAAKAMVLLLMEVQVKEHGAARQQQYQHAPADID